MKYVILYGSIWRLEAESFYRLIRTIADGQPFQMADYGEPYGTVVADVSKMTTTEAKTILGVS